MVIVNLNSDSTGFFIVNSLEMVFYSDTFFIVRIVSQEIFSRCYEVFDSEFQKIVRK